MINGIEKAVIQNEKMQERLVALSSANPFRYHYQPLGEAWLDKIDELYQSYQGCREFLYIPSRQELKQSLASDTISYMGMIDEGRILVGLVKVEQLQFPYPFFVVPKREQEKGARYFGISGLLVAPKYRKQGVAKHIVENTVRALSRLGAKGVYADCDFRNKASFLTFSSHFNFIGFVDGREGMAGEQSIYTTFYYDLSEKYKRRMEKMRFDYRKTATLDEVVALLQRNMKKELGNFSYYEVEYKSGYNKIYVIDKPVDIRETELVIGQEWEKSLANANIDKNVVVFGSDKKWELQAV